MSAEVTIAETLKGQHADKVEQSDAKFSCPKCGHKSREEWELPMHANEFARRLKYMSKCKLCGGPMNMGWPVDATKTE